MILCKSCGRRLHKPLPRNIKHDLCDICILKKVGDSIKDTKRKKKKDKFFRT